MCYTISDFALAAAVGVNLIWPWLSSAATLNVPTDYPTIQSCIDAAVTGVDECVVAPGTYHEAINFLGKAITLRSSGGASATTIDATGLAASVVTCASGEGTDTVLEGFTITGGTGTPDAGRTYGGGMINFSSSPTVTHCIFSGNRVNFRGGGMYNVADSNPTVTDCTFNGNRANFYGGGMHNMSDSNATVTHCTFSGNSAWQGGAMYNDVSSPTVTYCAFIANEVGAGGGGIFNLFGNTTVTHCTFSGNIAGYSGSGMYNQYSNPEVTNCTFSANTGKYGGGMYNESSNPAVVDCVFSGNMTSYGGGMFNVSGAPTATNCTFIANSAVAFGGAMYNQGGNSRTTDCTFIANTAGSGGGMINLGGSPSVTNCTFSANSSTADGGGMFNLDSSPAVANCILWGNSPFEIVNTDLSLPTMAFNDVQGGLPIGVVDGGRNIDLDPSFVRSPDPGPDGEWDGVDDDYGDLRLSPGSPCIDAGDPAFVPLPGETDLDGHARVLCARVDTGAYEFGIGDYDCDQAVDLTDFASWSSCMTGPMLSHEAILPGNAVNWSFLAQRAATRQPSFLAQRAATRQPRATPWVTICSENLALKGRDTPFSLRRCPPGQAPPRSHKGTIEYGQSTIKDRQLAIGNRQLAIGCESFDFNADSAVDLLDFAAFQCIITAP